MEYTKGKLKQGGSVLYTENGNVASLCDPTKYKFIDGTPISLSSRNWAEAMANGKRILQAWNEMDDLRAQLASVRDALRTNGISEIINLLRQDRVGRPDLADYLEKVVRYATHA